MKKCSVVVAVALGALVIGGAGVAHALDGDGAPLASRGYVGAFNTAGPGNMLMGAGTGAATNADCLPTGSIDCGFVEVAVPTGCPLESTGSALVCSAGGGGGGHTIQDEGSDQPQRTKLNFVGAGVECGDAGTVADATDCTIDADMDKATYDTGDDGAVDTCNALAADPADCPDGFAKGIGATGTAACVKLDHAYAPTDGYMLAADGADWLVVPLPTTPCGVWQEPVYVPATDSWGCAAPDTAGVVGTYQLAADAVTDAKVADAITVNIESGKVSSPSYPNEKACFDGLGDLYPAGPCTDDDIPESGDFGAAAALEPDGSLSAGAVTLQTLSLCGGLGGGKIPECDNNGDCACINTPGGASLAVLEGETSIEDPVDTISVQPGLSAALNGAGRVDVSPGAGAYYEGKKVLATDLPIAGTWSVSADVPQLTSDPDSANDPVRLSYADQARCWVQNFTMTTGSGDADGRAYLGGREAASLLGFFNYPTERALAVHDGYCWQDAEAADGTTHGYSIEYCTPTSPGADGGGATCATDTAVASCSITGTTATTENSCSFDGAGAQIPAGKTAFIEFDYPASYSGNRRRVCSVTLCTVAADD